MISKREILKSKIMLVDDDPMVVLLIEEVLESAGYTSLKSINNPLEAYSLYVDFQPNLILLDINMPYMNGFQVMEKLKESDQGKYLPILVLTSIEDRKSRLTALKAGARDYINKPFDKVEMLIRINNMLEVHLFYKSLEEKVRKRTNEIHETRLEIIHRLGLAAEYKDDETGKHIIRMSKMCFVLGKAAGMSDRELEFLLNASPMHDIGKIGIPDKILQKKGRLDPDERKIMETHTTIGASLLSGHPSELMKLAKTIAFTHHEKWDGSGYPNNLAGKEIPLVCRICGLCDVFDALTSERPYKKAWRVEDAVAEVKRCSGNHFDPELVNLFMANLPDVLAIIKEQYSSKLEIDMDRFNVA